MFFRPPHLMMKRELLLKVPFTRGLRRHQDWDWILRAGNAPGVGIEFISDALAIWNIDDPLSPLKTQYHWRYSWEWIRANRELVTPRAYAGFVAVTLSAQASWQGDWRAFWPLLREIVWGTRKAAVYGSGPVFCNVVPAAQPPPRDAVIILSKATRIKFHIRGAAATQPLKACLPHP